MSPAIPAPEINTLICCSWRSERLELTRRIFGDLKLSEQAALSIGWAAGEFKGLRSTYSSLAGARPTIPLCDISWIEILQNSILPRNVMCAIEWVGA